MRAWRTQGVQKTSVGNCTAKAARRLEGEKPFRDGLSPSHHARLSRIACSADGGCGLADDFDNDVGLRQHRDVAALHLGDRRTHTL